MKTIRAQILSYRSPQRYVVRRALQAAFNDLRRAHPEVELVIEEISAVEEILKITPILVQPCLALNGRLMCNGGFPKKDEVLAWLKTALDEQPQMLQDQE